MVQGMNESVHDEIACLEERIETLSLSIERCRKISLAAKLFIAAGAIVLIILVLGQFIPTLLFAAVAAIIGGSVLLGSNKTTWEQMDTARREAEVQRTQLIGRLNMRLVGENRKTAH